LVEDLLSPRRREYLKAETNVILAKDTLSRKMTLVPISIALLDDNHTPSASIIFQPPSDFGRNKKNGISKEPMPNLNALSRK